MVGTTGILAVLAVIAGVSNALPPQKIVGGTPAAPGEFPYQISLQVNGQHICGGTIIGKRYILTAAHCVISLPEIPTVVTGTISSIGGQSHIVKSMIYHKNYNPADFKSQNDIALIILAADITFNSYQNQLPLATAPTPVGVNVVASGWGFTNFAVKRINLILLKATLNTISLNQCQQMFDRTGVIYENQVCTYNRPGVGTCVGDSGGPLVYNGQLVGVVSYGHPCAIGLPDVFTSVYHHLSWINNIIKA